MDFDDVLFDFNGAIHPYHNSLYGTNLDKEHITSFALEDFWACSVEEKDKRVCDFYQSTEHQDTPPVPGSIEGVKSLKQKHQLYIVTARPEQFKHFALEWLSKYFPNMFEEIHCTNQYLGIGPKRTKGEVCKELGLDVFVEDALHNADDIANCGIPVLLFNTTWNQAEVKPPIIRVNSWDEIVKALS